MPTLVPRSPALRVLRNLALAWVGLSLLGLAAAAVLSIYAMGWGCTGEATWSGDLSWGACALAWSVGILVALGSLFASVVMLFFVQLFYWAGVEVKQARPRRWFSREALFDEIADTALDASDLLD
jgi:hypothetical protein